MSKRILMVCPIGLGNFLMAEPAIRMISQHFGSAHCELLALRIGVADLAQNSGLVQVVHLWDPDTQGLIPGLQLIKKLRQHKYEWIISLFPTGHWKYSAFLATLRTQKRAGFIYPQNPLSKFQKPALQINLERHDTEQNLRLACCVTGSSCPVDSSISPALKPVAAAPIPCESYFVCHPGSSAERFMEHKRAKPELFATLIQSIYQEFNIKCLLIGGPEELELRQKISSLCQSDSLVDRPSKSLADLSALMASSLFYLGNDSGLMHIATSLQKPVVAFFGPTDEHRTGPWLATGVAKLILRNENFSCGPCWTLKNLGQNESCPKGNYPCLNEYAIDQIWPKLKVFIKDLQA